MCVYSVPSLQFAPDFKVIVPKTYLKNPPTTREVAQGQPHQPVIVQQRVNILNIDRIDTVNMMFALTMEVSFEWKDPRYVVNLGYKSYLVNLLTIHNFRC